MPDELLRVEGLCAGYGAPQVLEHLSFSMGHESVTIVGRNGMGKTTLCNTLMGLKSSAGEVTFAGERIDGLNRNRSHARIAYIPQGRRLFPSLSVDEHLSMLAKGRQALDTRRGVRTVPTTRRATQARRSTTLRWRTADAGRRPPCCSTRRCI